MFTIVVEVLVAAMGGALLMSAWHPIRPETAPRGMFIAGGVLLIGIAIVALGVKYG